MLDAIKPLLESGIVNDDTRKAISEAWEAKLSEAREEVRAELREEFAQRYEHDKSVMFEALDKMVTESLTAEIAEFHAEKKALAEDRAKFAQRMVKSSKQFNEFMVKQLAEEIKELRQDRKQYENSVSRLERFVVKSLAEEIQEFEQDKQAVVETKVHLVAEAKEKMAAMQRKFIERSSVLVREAVSKNLETELGQLKEDIQTARENMFGRRIFEAFASEYLVTHLNENKEIAKLRGAIKRQNALIAEAKKELQKRTRLVESKDREVRMVKESVERQETMGKLLRNLNREKAAVMGQLLESVQTSKLQAAFDKYLPAVLNNSAGTKPANERAAMLVESRVEVTGDKSAKAVDSTTNDNVIEIKRLAGLK
jgi:hypothetical protein